MHIFHAYTISLLLNVYVTRQQENMELTLYFYSARLQALPHAKGAICSDAPQATPGEKQCHIKIHLPLPEYFSEPYPLEH